MYSSSWTILAHHTTIDNTTAVLAHLKSQNHQSQKAENVFVEPQKAKEPERPKSGVLNWPIKLAPIPSFEREGYADRLKEQKEPQKAREPQRMYLVTQIDQVRQKKSYTLAKLYLLT